MKTMKTGVIKWMLISAALLLFACGTKGTKGYDLNRTPPFSIFSATFQEWIGGAPGTSKGYNVSIQFDTITDDIGLDSIYFRKARAKLIMTSQAPLQFNATLKSEPKPDVIMHLDPVQEAVNKPAAPFPFDLERNEAVISYWHFGQIRYFRIKKLMALPAVAYPGSNDAGDH